MWKRKGAVEWARVLGFNLEVWDEFRWRLSWLEGDENRAITGIVPTTARRAAMGEVGGVKAAVLARAAEEARRLTEEIEREWAQAKAGDK